jgi:hypothetical protein
MGCIAFRYTARAQHRNCRLGEPSQESNALVSVGWKALGHDGFFQPQRAKDLHAARIDDMTTGMRGRRCILFVDDRRYALMGEQQGARQPHRTRADNRNVRHRFLRHDAF